jgi:hypothetical protein
MVSYWGKTCYCAHHTFLFGFPTERTSTRHQQVPRCCWRWHRAINYLLAPASNNLQKWFLSPTGRLNFGFILRENLLLCSSYLPLGVSQLVLWDIRVFISSLFSATMDERIDVRDWAPSGCTGRCYLLRHAAWWGIWVLSSTRIFFGGGRVGQAWYRGNRPARRWCVAISERRMSTSVVVCMCWKGFLPTPGRVFRDLMWDMILCGFLIFECPPPVAQHPVDVRFERIMGVLWCTSVVLV